jgi:hypothetical protein
MHPIHVLELTIGDHLDIECPLKTSHLQTPLLYELIHFAIKRISSFKKLYNHIKGFFLEIDRNS